MKKINEKLKSVRVKLFLTVSVVIICTIALLVVVNSIVLEGFYTYSKIAKVKQEFYKINDLYNGDDSSVLTKIKRDAMLNNFDILIESEDYILIFSTNESFTNAIGKNSEIVSHFKIDSNERQFVIYSKDNLVIKKITSNGLNCILLSGELDNGYKAYIQITISSIEESVRISNNLLLIIGFIAVIIAGIAASFVSRKFTSQILELNVIANKMSKLDFSQKYKPSQTDDEINELGISINLMSEKLEGTIKQLRSSNNQLERDIEEKSKIDEMRKSFISDVSHELKTPIALIQGYSEGLLENVNTDEESRKFYAEVILDETNKMDKLVKQLLELMKLEYGKRQFNDKKFNIVEVEKEVVRKSKVMLEEKKVKIEFNLSEEINVFADDFYIEQVISNYITNAIKHVKEIDGKKVISIVNEVNIEKNKVRVKIFNTGENIAEEHINRIWNRFYKVDESRNRTDGGTGIGLSFVKAIMNNYGNRYGVTNKEDGVEFYFDLDLIV